MGTKERVWATVKVGLSAVIIAGLCGVPVYLFIQNAVQSSGAESQTAAKELGAPRNGYFGDATPIYSSPTTDVCVAFEFLGFDPVIVDRELRHRHL